MNKAFCAPYVGSITISRDECTRNDMVEATLAHSNMRPCWPNLGVLIAKLPLSFIILLLLLPDASNYTLMSAAFATMGHEWKPLDSSKDLEGRVQTLLGASRSKVTCRICECSIGKSEALKQRQSFVLLICEVNRQRVEVSYVSSPPYKLIFCS